MELRLVNANKETEDRQMSAPVYQGIADHIVAAIREKDAIVERLERENAALREALTDAASRFADAATVMRERPDYYNPDYYERTAWRCWHVLNRGGRYHDDNYDNPPPTREPTETPPARDCSNDQAGSAKAAGAPGAESTAALDQYDTEHEQRWPNAVTPQPGDTA
jgi:hypothetical protein